MREMIHIDFDNVKDEIDEFVSWNLGNYGDGNGSGGTRHLIFINFSINNRLGHSKQLITTIEIILIDVDNTEANNIVSLLFR